MLMCLIRIYLCRLCRFTFFEFFALSERLPLRKSRYFLLGEFFFKKLNWHFLTQISIKVRAHGIVEKYSHFALSLFLSLFPSLV